MLNHPTQGSSVMDESRNRFDDSDFEKAPSLLDKPANPGPAADDDSAISSQAWPAVVWARPQFLRRVADEPKIPVKLACWWPMEDEKRREKKNTISWC